MITLLINYYIDANTLRQKELDYCLMQNINNPLIDQIVIFHNEDIPVLGGPKIKSVFINKRLSFTDFFNYGNAIEGIKIIANSDVYFNETLENVKHIKANSLFALSRWESEKHAIAPPENKYSQDAWIWIDKIFINVDFGLGIPGCDNVLAYALIDLGYKVYNPSLSVRCVHVHESKVRNYEKKPGENKYRVIGKYAALEIICIEDVK